MASLVDIAPLHETVTIGDVEIDCRGLGIEAIAHALSGSEDLQRLMAEVRTDPARILHEAPRAAHALIAAGIGKLGDKAEEEAAARLSIDHQLELFEAIWRCSFPRGFGPFVERLYKLVGADRAAVLGRALGTSSPPPLSD